MAIAPGCAFTIFICLGVFGGISRAEQPRAQPTPPQSDAAPRAAWTAVPAPLLANSASTSAALTAVAAKQAAASDTLALALPAGGLAAESAKAIPAIAAAPGKATLAVAPMVAAAVAAAQQPGPPPAALASDLAASVAPPAVATAAPPLLVDAPSGAAALAASAPDSAAAPTAELLGTASAEFAGATLASEPVSTTEAVAGAFAPPAFAGAASDPGATPGSTPAAVAEAAPASGAGAALAPTAHAASAPGAPASVAPMAASEVAVHAEVRRAASPGSIIRASKAPAEAVRVVAGDERTTPADGVADANLAVGAAADVASLDGAPPPAAAPHSDVAPKTVAPTAWSQYMPWLYAELSAFTFVGVIKSLCVISNIIVQVSPFPQVRRWARRGCTGETDAAPFVSIAFGGWQWSFYGFFAWWVTQRPGFLILVQSNCLGAILGTYYTTAYLRHCRHPPSMNTANRYLSAVAALAVFQCCCMCVLPLERALFLVGVIASFCSFVGALSMLVTVPQVLHTENARSIPLPYAVAQFAGSIVWMVCGFVLADPLVVYPNVMAVASSSICLVLKHRYPSDDPNEAEFEEDDFGCIFQMLGMQSRDQTLPPSKKACKARPPDEFTPIARSARTASARTSGLRLAMAAAAAAHAESSRPRPELRTWGEAAAAGPERAGEVVAACAGWDIEVAHEAPEVPEVFVEEDYFEPSTVEVQDDHERAHADEEALIEEEETEGGRGSPESRCGSDDGDGDEGADRGDGELDAGGSEDMSERSPEDAAAATEERSPAAADIDDGCCTGGTF